MDESIIFSGARVGRNAQIRRAILDKWTVVPDGESIGFDLDRDRQRFTVTDSGIVVVPTKFRF